MAVTKTILGQWALAPALGARVACKGSRTGTPQTRLETWGGPTGLPPQTGAPCPCHDFAPPPSAAQTYLECLKNHQMKNNYLIYLYSLPINVSPNNIEASRRTSMPENLSGQQSFFFTDIALCNATMSHWPSSSSLPCPKGTACPYMLADIASTPAFVVWRLFMGRAMQRRGTWRMRHGRVLGRELKQNA